MRKFHCICRRRDEVRYITSCSQSVWLLYSDKKTIYYSTDVSNPDSIRLGLKWRQIDTVQFGNHWPWPSPWCAWCSFVHIVKLKLNFQGKRENEFFFLILAHISNCNWTPLNIQNFTIPISKHMPEQKLQYCHYSPQIRAARREEKFHWNSNIVISLMANSLNLNSAYL